MQNTNSKHNKKGGYKAWLRGRKRARRILSGLNNREDEFQVEVRNNGQTKMLHYTAHDGDQAAAKADGHGQIVSVRKVEYAEIYGNIEKLNLKQPPEFVDSSPYETAVAMDELIWDKRNKRRMNQEKDKKSY